MIDFIFMMYTKAPAEFAGLICCAMLIVGLLRLNMKAQ